MTEAIPTYLKSLREKDAARHKAARRRSKENSLIEIRFKTMPNEMPPLVAALLSAGLGRIVRSVKFLAAAAQQTELATDSAAQTRPDDHKLAGNNTKIEAVTGKVRKVRTSAETPLAMQQPVPQRPDETIGDQQLKLF
jgi:hypothetical protein